MLKAALLENEVRKCDQGADVRLRIAWMGPPKSEADMEFALASEIHDWAEERMLMLAPAVSTRGVG